MLISIGLIDKLFFCLAFIDCTFLQIAFNSYSIVWFSVFVINLSSELTTSFFNCVFFCEGARNKCNKSLWHDSFDLTRIYPRRPCSKLLIYPPMFTLSSQIHKLLTSSLSFSSYFVLLAQPYRRTL